MGHFALKIANFLLFLLLASLVVPLVEPGSGFDWDLAIVVGLLLIPITFLTASYWEGKRNTVQRILMLGAFYNGGVATFLIFHAATMMVSGSHPIAFAITEQVFSILVGIWSALNASVLELRRRKVSRTHDA
jgi:hypothetical protein